MPGNYQRWKLSQSIYKTCTFAIFGDDGNQQQTFKNYEIYFSALPNYTVGFLRCSRNTSIFWKTKVEHRWENTCCPFHTYEMRVQLSCRLDSIWWSKQRVLPIAKMTKVVRWGRSWAGKNIQLATQYASDLHTNFLAIWPRPIQRSPTTRYTTRQTD